jgi:hypothetical protein
MNKPDICTVIDFLHGLGKLQTVCGAHVNPRGHVIVPTQDMHQKVREALASCGLRVSLRAFDRYDDLIGARTHLAGQPMAEMQAMEDAAETLAKSIADEISTVILLSVDPRREGLYRNPLAGWDDVLAVLPDCSYDAEETSICLAFDRPTASAFHAMRVVEEGLKHLWTRTKLNPTAQNWGGVAQRHRHIRADAAVSSK